MKKKNYATSARIKTYQSQIKPIKKRAYIHAYNSAALMQVATPAGCFLLCVSRSVIELTRIYLASRAVGYLFCCHCINMINLPIIGF